MSEMLITPQETAKLLRSGVSTLYRLLAQGKIPPPLRIGRKTFWRRAELQGWLEAGAPSIEQWTQRRTHQGKKDSPTA